MTPQQEPRALTRRQAMALGTAFAAMPLAASQRATAAEPAPDTIIARPIPSSGERLPVVGLGTDQYYSGGAAPQAALDQVIRALVAGGGSVVDTSSDYGASESLIATVLRESALHPKVFIATKLEKSALHQPEIEASLRRLGTATIDLMQIHNVSSNDQSLAPLREWKTQGLIRYIGITTSVDSAFDAMEAVMRREKPDFVELNYSLGDREAEKRLLPAAAELGIGTLIDEPLGGHGRNLMRTVQGKSLPDWAGEFGAASWAQFILKYVLGHPAVTCVIPGTRNPEHMADNLAAGRGPLPDAAQRQRMARFFDAL